MVTLLSCHRPTTSSLRPRSVSSTRSTTGLRFNVFMKLMGFNVIKMTPLRSHHHQPRGSWRLLIMIHLFKIKTLLSARLRGASRTFCAITRPAASATLLKNIRSHAQPLSFQSDRSVNHNSPTGLFNRRLRLPTPASTTFQGIILGCSQR